jgi:hypothetical protein
MRDWIVLMALALVLSLTGCYQQPREEKVLDIEAPGLDIEVNKTEEHDGTSRLTIETETNEAEAREPR